MWLLVICFSVWQCLLMFIYLNWVKWMLNYWFWSEFWGISSGSGVTFDGHLHREKELDLNLFGCLLDFKRKDDWKGPLSRLILSPPDKMNIKNSCLTGKKFLCNVKFLNWIVNPRHCLSTSIQKSCKSNSVGTKTRNIGNSLPCLCQK